MQVPARSVQLPGDAQDVRVAKRGLFLPELFHLDQQRLELAKRLAGEDAAPPSAS